MPLLPITLSFLIALAPADLGEPKKVTSKAGGFTVSMPGKTEQKTINEKTSAGPAEVHVLVSEVDGITFIASGAVNSAKVPVDQNSPYFDNIRESATTGPGKTLQKERRGVYHKMPMCYYRYAMTAPNGKAYVVQARYLIADPTHIYTLQVFIPKNINIDTEVHDFFESLEIGEPPALKGEPKASAKEKAMEKDGLGPVVAAKWRLFTPADKGFSVSMPGEPTAEKQDIVENSTKVDTYTVDLGDRAYSAVCYDFPAKIAQQDPGTTLNNLTNGMAQSMKGTVAELKPVKDEGLEGREFRIEFTGPGNVGPAIARGRAYLVGTKVYVLAYNGSKGTEDREEVRKFLVSFQLARSSPPAKAKAKGRP
jgi:hypothetical protein